MSSSPDTTEHRHRAEWVVPLALGVMAVLKTLRLANDWAITQDLIDYSQGFVKRGLLGEVYRSMHWISYGALQGVSLIELAAMLVLLFTLGVRSRIGRATGNSLLPAVFWGSFALSFLVHMVGYTDVVNVALCVGLLLVRRPMLRLLLALPFCTAAMLMHENFVLTQFPVVLFSFGLDTLMESKKEKRRSIWVQASVLTAVVFALTVMVSTWGLVSPQKAEMLHQAALRHADLDIHPFVFTVLSRDFAGNLAITAERRMQDAWKLSMELTLAELVPAALLLAVAGWRLLWGQPLSRSARVLLCSAALVVGLCPLGMHLLGFDAARWNCLCLLNLYLVLCALAMRLAPVDTGVLVAERNLTVVVLAIGIASGYGLMDQEDVNAYPYWPAWKQSLLEYRARVAQQHELRN